MEENNIIGFTEEDFDDENARYVLTPHAILYETLRGYGIDVGKWYQKLWESIFETFMNDLERSGYVEKKSDEEG